MIIAADHPVDFDSDTNKEDPAAPAFPLQVFRLTV